MKPGRVAAWRVSAAGPVLRRLACALRAGALLASALLLHLLPLPAHAAAPGAVPDDAGNLLRLPHVPMRIISMAPHLTELLFAAGAGARIVGTVSYSDFPQQALTIPRIGSAGQLDVERVIALQPDLIVVWQQGSSAAQVAQLRRLGVPLYFSQSRRLEDIAGSLERLGTLLGTSATAGPAAARLRERLAALTARHAGQAPVRTFYQVWDRPLYTLNGSHVVTDALRVCGAVNIFAGLDAAAPMVGIEAVLQADPELIVGTSESSTPGGGVMLWKAYPALRATKANNLTTVDGNLLNRAGPRMIDGAAALCARVQQARAHRSAVR